MSDSTLTEARKATTSSEDSAAQEEAAGNAWKEFLAARKELIAIEAKEVGQFALGKGIAAAILAFGFLFFWLLLMMATASLLGSWLGQRYDQTLIFGSEISWEVPALCIALIHLVMGLMALAKLKKSPREAFFSYTMKEIEKDRQWLKNKK